MNVLKSVAHINIEIHTTCEHYWDMWTFNKLQIKSSKLCAGFSVIDKCKHGYRKWGKKKVDIIIMG